MIDLTLIEILTQEEKLLDNILDYQVVIKSSVMERDWVTLEKNITKMQDCATKFIELDNERESMKISNYSKEEHELMKTIQSKLLKSKTINNALNDYIKISREFVETVLDKVVPQRNDVVYSQNGTFVKTETKSVVLNKVF